MQNNNNSQAIIKGLQLFEAARQQHAASSHAKAAALYQQALGLMPDHPAVLAEYGRLAEDVADWQAAEKIFRRIGALRPNSNFEGHVGHALFRLERFSEAIDWLEKHIARNPADADVIHALGNCYCASGRWEDGLACARRAYALKPEAKVLDAVLNALFHLARADELEALINDALRRFPESPEIRSMYALHKLKAGDYENGFAYFADFRWRHNLKTPPDAGTPGEPWNGKPFDGTLLVTAEQGLGDEIMVSSVFADLVALGQAAIVECDTRLIPVYARSFPSLRFVPRHQKKLVEAFNQGGSFRRINGLDLVGFFRNGKEKFPDRHAWLLPDAERTATLRADYRQCWPGRRLIGLSWKSTRVMEGGAMKNVRLENFEPLLGTANTAFINVQYGDVADDINRLRAAGMGDIFVDARIDATNDLDGLFAQIAALDLIVSTSNTTVHIAGALGITCLVLLPKIRPVLWYWGYQGTSTPWYPSLELLRNTCDDDWRVLMNTAAARLADFVTLRP
ncbi:MAG: tetratricopeptide repeat protein [Pseudomonadota bacterium]